MTFESPSSGQLREDGLIARPPDLPASILILDDDPWVCQALRLVLRHYRVTAMQEASTALCRLRSGDRYDAILCDVVMPVLGGAALYDVLLVEAPDQAARMIFMTGGATTEEAMDFVEQERAPVLLKPFSPEALRLEIATLLARHGVQGGPSPQ